MDEILKMSREIDYKNLVYGFKGPTSSISFSKFADPVCTYDQLKNGEKNTKTSRRRTKRFLKYLNEIVKGNLEHKSDKQLYNKKLTKEFTLPDELYSVSDIQDYFKYVLKKHGENTDKPSVKIYVNKIENRITFKIKNGDNLELLTKEKMKLLGSTENKITKDKNRENVPHPEITEVLLVHCNIVNNDYQ